MSWKSTVRSNVIDKCWEFSKKAYVSPREFNQSDARSRPHQEVSRDQFIGKVCEFGFSNMIWEHYQIRVWPDLKIYSKGQGDRGDLIFNQKRIEVKGVRSSPVVPYLLVETDQIKNKIKLGIEPDFYALLTLAWHRIEDRISSGEVTLIGLIERQEFYRTGMLLGKGKQLPKRNVVLQSENWALEGSELLPMQAYFADGWCEICSLTPAMASLGTCMYQHRGKCKKNA